LPVESRRVRRERAQAIVDLLGATYPDSRCSLEHDSPYQLLLATVLSAQCTDALVNRVTPELFRRYPAAADLAAAPLEEIEDTIRQVNFYRNKAKALKALGAALVDRHGGEVPREMDDLVALPGVGRKTANVVRGVAWNLADGVVVDTHVKRISRLLRLTRAEDPISVEQDLLALLPEEARVVFTHRVIDHGRAVCVARRPRCGECVLSHLCPSALVPARLAG
jgi:endonuclease-3